MDDDIPIFDSLTHPSLDGNWISPGAMKVGNRFGDVAADMQGANVRWAWAVSMGTQGGYDTSRYVEACAQCPTKFFPAAFLSINEFGSLAQIVDWLTERKAQGFAGVKLHPRLGRFNLRHEWLPHAIDTAGRLGLIVLLCTYFYSGDPALHAMSLESLRDLLLATAGRRIILLHGGSVRLLELSEMTRPFKSTLLDLSFTMCEFAGSSLDLDLRYVLDRCQNRVCVGSDSPEFSAARMRERFEQLTAGFGRKHRERIAFRNMFEFTGLPFHE